VESCSSHKKRSAFSTPCNRQVALQTSADWRSGSSDGSRSEKISENSLILRSKESELSTLGDGPKILSVSSDNAQAIYPPSACVFVAK
jgi:hypothetical protein